MSDLPLEHCRLCDEPTGRAGRGDDSIYCELLNHIVLGGVPYDSGDEIGPLCSGCKDTLVADGEIVDE